MLRNEREKSPFERFEFEESRVSEKENANLQKKEKEKEKRNSQFAGEDVFR